MNKKGTFLADNLGWILLVIFGVFLLIIIYPRIITKSTDTTTSIGDEVHYKGCKIQYDNLKLPDSTKRDLDSDKDGALPPCDLCQYGKLGSQSHDIDGDGTPDACDPDPCDPTNSKCEMVNGVCKIVCNKDANEDAPIKDCGPLANDHKPSFMNLFNAIGKKNGPITENAYLVGAQKICWGDGNYPK